MKVAVEAGRHNNGIQTTRIVADVINSCNLGCHYCHPNFGGWTGEGLTAQQIEGLFVAAEELPILELTMTGGEITMHPEFGAIMDATHRLDKTAVSFVTNATKITPQIVKEVRDSRVDRVCVSLDGPDAKSHGSRRGNNFDVVMNGLEELQAAGKPITVISVAHKQNYHQLTDLSYMLAERGLADQHHICAASYSGAAKKIYSKFAFDEEEFHSMQYAIDKENAKLRSKGMFVTFNSYWPATGERAQSADPRTMTLIQFNEQVKDIYMIVRPNGDVRLAAASWGRETVGNAVVGNLTDNDALSLLEAADEIYRSGRVKQLPRDVEAAHKFMVGPHVIGNVATNALLQDKSQAIEQMDISVPVRPLSEIDLLENPLSIQQLDLISTHIASDPNRWRVARHATGVDLLFDRSTSHTTVLKPAETEQILRAVNGC